jgi:hypothetical protein
MPVRIYIANVIPFESISKLFENLMYSYSSSHFILLNLQIC